MNTVRIREEVKEMRKAGAISAKLAHAWLQAPVFYLPKADTIDWPPYRQWYEEHLEDPPSKLPRHYPFKEFIICEAGAVGPRYIAVGDKGKLEGVTVFSFSQHPNRRVWGHATVNETEQSLSKITIYVDGKLVDWRKLYKDEAEFDLIYGDIAPAIRLCVLVLSKTSTVLQVAPQDKTQSRSAEWKLARTHYVILTPKQAQECSKQRRGPTERDVVLAAHWRRAHFRRLMAAKFSETKRGKLVPVKQAWVGPKEWFGLDDKVYKVVEVEGTSDANPPRP